MLLHKTDQARTALASNSTAALTLQQRRILILTDGRRSINDIMALLGNGILADVDALIRAGFLSTSQPISQGSQVVDTLARGLRGATTLIATATAARGRDGHASAPAPAAATAAPAEPAQQTQPQQTPAPTRGTVTTRRSLAASKMYVMDMLQMQRDPVIAECRADIQCAQDEAATVVALLDGVRQLIPRMSAGMASRVVARLDDILPEPFLPALRSLESEITGKPVLAITNVA